MKSEIIAIRVTPDILESIDNLVASGDYKSRSEFLDFAIHTQLNVPSARQVTEQSLADCSVQLKSIMTKFEYLVHETEKTRVPKSEALEVGKNPA